MTTPHIVNMTDTYRTRDGRAVRVLCVDKKGNYSVVALVYECGIERVVGYRPNGTGGGSKFDDLIRASPPREWWVNAYDNYIDNAVHKTRAMADECASPKRIACYRCVDDNGSCTMTKVWSKDQQ